MTAQTFGLTIGSNGLGRRRCGRNTQVPRHSQLLPPGIKVNGFQIRQYEEDASDRSQQCFQFSQDCHFPPRKNTNNNTVNT
ncbi:Hypothetical predicted protein [Podarcis lilfordi]|uniref:Uncharacterized protein n=1 Tax=Podarcis lilfordi TaxID=74358 RepID=A0AA35K574_9SAUR|nr:Hypothetical predicted protein [Podarcis lilfordi]